MPSNKENIIIDKNNKEQTEYKDCIDKEDNKDSIDNKDKRKKECIDKEEDKRKKECIDNNKDNKDSIDNNIKDNNKQLNNNNKQLDNKQLNINDRVDITTLLYFDYVLYRICKLYSQDIESVDYLRIAHNIKKLLCNEIFDKETYLKIMIIKIYREYNKDKEFNIKSIVYLIELVFDYNTSYSILAGYDGTEELLDLLLTYYFILSYGEIGNETFYPYIEKHYERIVGKIDRKESVILNIKNTLIGIIDNLSVPFMEELAVEKVNIDCS